jgi:hypothetical protein
LANAMGWVNHKFTSTEVELFRFSHSFSSENR